MNEPVTVDPRVIADALQMDTLSLAQLLCTYASDSLPSETWRERSYEPCPLETFDDHVARARWHLEAAHAAMQAWNEDNPDFGEVEPE